MAKTKVGKAMGLTEDERVEQATLEANVQAQERAEARTTDERVAEVFAAPEPVETPAESVKELTPAEVWHQEAGEILALTSVGTPVSPARVVAALSRAVGLVPKA